MKRSIVVLLLGVVLTGCSSSPKLLNTAPGQYTLLGEAEFGYTEMVQDLYAEANTICNEQNKTMSSGRTYTGKGSTGVVGPKSMFQLNFRCH